MNATDRPISGFYILTLLFAVSLPFTMLADVPPESKTLLMRFFKNTQWNSVLIALLTIYWVSEGAWLEKWKKLRKNQWIPLFLIFYGWQWLGMLYTESLSDGWHEITVKTTILLFPIIYASTKHRFTQLQFQGIFWAFGGAVLLASLITFRGGFYFIFDPDSGLPTFESAIILHRPYLGMYVSLVICFFLYTLITMVGRKWEKWLIFGVFYLVVFLIITDAFISLGICILSLLLTSSLWLVRRGFFRLFWLGFLTVVVIFFLFRPKIQSIWNDFQIDQVRLTEMPEAASENKARANIRSCVKSILGQSSYWLTGLGTGDANQALLHCYESKGMDFEARHHLNAHHIFFQETLRHGLFGLLLLMSLLGFPLWWAFKQEKYLYLAFLLLIILVGLTESLLSRQAGVVFYAFFNTLFLFETSLIKLPTEAPEVVEDSAQN